MTKFDVITHMGRELSLGDSHASHAKGRSPRAPQFLWFAYILTYILRRKNEQIRRVAAHRREGEREGGRVLGRSATSKHIAHNATRGLSAIAEFLIISDIWRCLAFCEVSINFEC